MTSSSVSWIGGILLLVFVAAVLIYLVRPDSMRSGLVTHWTCPCARARKRQQQELFTSPSEGEEIEGIEKEKDGHDLEKQETNSSGDWDSLLSGNTIIMHDADDIRPPPPAAIAEPKPGPESRPWV
ncbi:MAG: hypothetical protein Q9227_003140 [Pyrenula ochraceoflavens]